jgi:hypothetical protein
MVNGANGGAANGGNAPMNEEDEPSRIRLEIQHRERQLAEHRTLLEEARGAKTKAETTRREVMLAARVDGDAEARRKLDRVSSVWAKAETEEQDLGVIVSRLQTIIEDLRKQLQIAERKQVEDEIAAIAMKRIARAAEIDQHIEAALRLMEQTLADAATMQGLAVRLQLFPQTFDCTSALGSFIHCVFAPSLPHHFTGNRTDVRMHYAKPWLQIERERLGGHCERVGIELLPKEEQEQPQNT